MQDERDEGEAQPCAAGANVVDAAPATEAYLAATPTHVAMDEALREAMKFKAAKAKGDLGLYRALHRLRCYFVAVSRNGDADKATAAEGPPAVAGWRYASFDEVCDNAVGLLRSTVRRSIREVLVYTLMCEVLLAPTSAMGATHGDRALAAEACPSTYRCLTALVSKHAPDIDGLDWMDCPVEALVAWFKAPEQHALRATLWSIWRRACATMRSDGKKHMMRHHVDAARNAEEASDGERPVATAQTAGKRARKQDDDRAPEEALEPTSGRAASEACGYRARKMPRHDDAACVTSISPATGVTVASAVDDVIDRVIDDVMQGDAYWRDEDAHEAHEQKVDPTHNRLGAHDQAGMETSHPKGQGEGPPEKKRQRGRRGTVSHRGSRNAQSPAGKRGTARQRTRTPKACDANADDSTGDSSDDSADEIEWPEEPTDSERARHYEYTAAIDGDLCECMTRYRDRFAAWPTVGGVPCDAIHGDDDNDGDDRAPDALMCDRRRQWCWRGDAVVGVTDVVKNLLDAITRCADYAHGAMMTALARRPAAQIMAIDAFAFRSAAPGSDVDVDAPNAPFGCEQVRGWHLYRMHARVFSAIAMLGGGPLTMMATAGLPFYQVSKYAAVAARYDDRGNHAPSLLPARPPPDAIRHELMQRRGDGVFPRRSVAHSLFANWFERNYALGGYKDAGDVDGVWYDDLDQKGTNKADRWCRDFWARRAAKYE
ncbi:hypothetical protein psal_cds_1427 [Pandoravirus salinus]|uniref:Uncharacterized protein n=1 Tax=Pandoravirus salinus TaxID=1349410 RepID=S4W547_9VIRU|nr:hypothetical protein psal_cds_1427 [Pandoravirus salinus]AGO85872.1 hypothetical protein psal_cds_1427 [Pandoravirus salinus]